MKQYVIYRRVSSAEQGRSGLGLEAQQRDIDIFLTNFSEVPWEIIGEFLDVQSGGDNGRPQLTKALELVRKSGAELLVAKLDRLSRKVSFVAGLMDDPKVKLRVAQMPQADKFQLHIYAALAEQEREFISARTKAALQAYKGRYNAAVDRERVLRGDSFNDDLKAGRIALPRKLGGNHDKTQRRNVAIQQKAAAEAAELIETIKAHRKNNKTLTEIAQELTRLKLPTSRGGQWTATQVQRMMKRSGLSTKRGAMVEP